MLDLGFNIFIDASPSILTLVWEGGGSSTVAAILRMGKLRHRGRRHLAEFTQGQGQGWSDLQSSNS